MNILAQLEVVMSAQKVYRATHLRHVQTRVRTSVVLITSMLAQPVPLLVKVGNPVIVQMD